MGTSLVTNYPTYSRLLHRIVEDYYNGMTDLNQSPSGPVIPYQSSLDHSSKVWSTVSKALFEVQNQYFSMTMKFSIRVVS